MSGHENSIKNYQYPAEPWVNKNPHWELWTAEVENPDGAGEPTGSNPLETARHLNERGMSGESELNQQAAICREGSEGDAIRQAYEEGRSAGLAEGLKQGRREGEAAGRDEEAERSKAERELEKRERSVSAAELISGFYREQEQYLHKVEHEVVKLSLALAARILRREAQMDPLLLTGAVRVALGQLSESTQVVLQVPEADLGLWKDAMRLVPNLSNRPNVVAGEGMQLGECRVLTEMGSVDLGVKAQLAEIERVFFDRVDQREAVNQSPAHSQSHKRLEQKEFSDREMLQQVSSKPSQRARISPLPAMEGQYLDEPVRPSMVGSLLNNEKGSHSFPDLHSGSHSAFFDAELTTESALEPSAESEAIGQKLPVEVLS